MRHVLFRSAPFIGLPIAVLAAVVAGTDAGLHSFGIALLASAIVPLWLQMICQHKELSDIATITRSHYGVPSDPKAISEHVMRCSLLRRDNDIDDVFLLQYFETLRTNDGYDAAKRAARAVASQEFVIDKQDVYPLMQTLTTRVDSYFGIATDADLLTALGRPLPRGGDSPSMAEQREAQSFLCFMPMEPAFVGRIRRLFWVSKPSLLRELDAMLGGRVSEAVRGNPHLFGMCEGIAEMNCGYYGQLARGDLDPRTGKNRVIFGNFTTERQRYEALLDDASARRLRDVLDMSTSNQSA